MAHDLVIGIDSSTTATKAIAWDRNGNGVAEGRSPLPLHSPAPGYYEQDPQDWWQSTAEALRELSGKVDPDRIAALSISNQRETFVVLDAHHQALRPGILWLDERCRAEVASFSQELGADLIHGISGKPPDVTPVLYELVWMARHEPEILARTARVCDVHAYLSLRLTGRCCTSWASADPLSCFDMQRRCWSETLLTPLGLSPQQFPETLAPGQIIGELSAEAAAATGLPPGTPVVTGGGDGQAAGLGCQVLNPGKAYLNLGTAVVSGVYSTEYLVDRAFRTMGSCSGEGYILESAMRSGTFLVDWFIQQMFGVDPARHPGIYAELEEEARQIPIGSGRLLLVPYWSGCMNPYWELDARGCMVGLSAAHGRGHLYRALLEGIALEQALCTSAAEQVCGESVSAYLAIGGGAASDLWCQIIADASGRDVQRSTTVEASSLGVAMAAAVGVGWFEDFASAASAMSGQVVQHFEPIPEQRRRYQALMEIYQPLYPRLRETYQALARFVDND